MTQATELFLTCDSWQEAQRIVDALLNMQLIACAEFIPITSKFNWKGQHSEADEVKLIMLSIEDNFDKIEKVVAKLHSYESFVLQAIPVTHLSKAATAWLHEVTE